VETKIPALTPDCPICNESYSSSYMPLSERKPIKFHTFHGVDHIFCEKCFEKIINLNLRCPLCRYKTSHKQKEELRDTLFRSRGSTYLLRLFQHFMFLFESNWEFVNRNLFSIGSAHYSTGPLFFGFNMEIMNFPCVQYISILQTIVHLFFILRDLCYTDFMPTQINWIIVVARILVYIEGRFIGNFFAKKFL
jgi:hypothetical protein